jgi:hypothetical protein
MEVDEFVHAVAANRKRFMTGVKQYISWATKFDLYKGELNWQNLPLRERTVIARFELEGTPEDLDIYEFVMGTNLRRIQFDGLRTVIVRAALALEERLSVRFGTDDSAKYSLVLPYLEGTAFGQELVSLLNGTAGEHTSYRMGELEFLAQNGSKPSPLDKLLDLPRDLRLQGIVALLESKGAFELRPKPEEDTIDTDLDRISFSEVTRLIQAEQLDVRASYTGSLQVVSQGGVQIGIVGTLAGVMFWAAPIAGLVAAFLFAWWWLVIGLVVGVSSFRHSRKAAVDATLRRALADQLFFEAMRKHKIIWLERLPSK